jgi:hypothetical protein
MERWIALNTLFAKTGYEYIELVRTLSSLIQKLGVATLQVHLPHTLGWKCLPIYVIKE